MTNGPAPSPFAAVVVAAGTGSRTGLDIPKQFAEWNGKPVLLHSLESLARAGADPIVVAIPEAFENLAREIVAGFDKVRLVHGGATRQASVRAALEAMAEDQPELVLIHDAARANLPQSVIGRLLAALKTNPGAIPVLPVVDSLAQCEDGMMTGTAERDMLRRVQTPQAFRFNAILAAHRSWKDAPVAGDDAQVLQRAGLEIVTVEGDEALKKLTFAKDFRDETRTTAPLFRTGMGYDVHRLAAGEELWLAGVNIPFELGLAGHSDADVALHAIVDAMLGAIGEGDIGTHFPPSDPRWKGASSDRFVIHATELVRAAGYRVANVDCTIICERPKIGPHRDAMRKTVASLLDVDAGLVSIKATTTERLGFTGRGEGIAAQAIVSLERTA
ncbi:bifunctional 2-C-methyl-D-erythritol 4-phosphate cytidylyltransferase/2-C-methyl-D-erythritol 2,4-cyclodiphosphate synthase [Altererythrobacter aurantiacus]|uniref:Bifunctional enzyme IspD/IspF n=1 Tax=Parapontixanthobacter aurantiacus TaxID=1463599 RepID=A0A844ZEF0_9SPHN|nr:bifunctional 2-C-methyl-D-erythritol 4-phosphate cytidylyltransferase/2-C-methyl-D-erythritol 2,4-cyclodiphosphate synthase [Parapontixanthobacter aurantiacus]MXO85340.1 bifunctional 2-C-methyl-D-erythritol 4-phosphate cytidylyltransferase/2-C-methyl-D-erythritol 2,4-cyclodiphosphate synthase [Parapontixanthobacter aurantiacus]